MSTDADLLRQRTRALGGETVYVVFDASAAWADRRGAVTHALAVYAQALLTFHANNLVRFVAQRDGRPRVFDALPADATECRVESLVDVALLHSCKQKRALPTRIVVVTATPITSFVAGMNGAFAAQKLETVVDVVDLSALGSPELVQVTQLTQGIYLRPQRSVASDLMQLVPDVATRQSLAPPPRPAVDLRAECFCHRLPVKTGYVCSVCLAVYCQVERTCPSCNVAVM